MGTENKLKTKMDQPGECQSAKVPTLFDHPSDGYIKYFCFGWWCPMIAACRLGQKYKLNCNLCIWLTALFFTLGFIAVSIGTAVSIGSDRVEIFNNYRNTTEILLYYFGNSDSSIQFSNRTVALIGVSCISGVVLAVVAIVGFVLLRRKFVRKTNMDENCCTSYCIMNLPCCFPCALGQMGSYATINHL